MNIVANNASTVKPPEFYFSKLNPNLRFRKTLWVVTLVNTGQGTADLVGSHAAIVVEGIRDDYWFVCLYDIMASVFKQQVPGQAIVGNLAGYITRVRVVKRTRLYQNEQEVPSDLYTVKGENRTLDLTFPGCSKKGHRAFPKNVLKLIEDVCAFEEKIKGTLKLWEDDFFRIIPEIPDGELVTSWEDIFDKKNRVIRDMKTVCDALNLPELPRYQVAGKHRAEALGGNGGDNCVTWAEERLKEAGIINTDRHSTDSIKAVPLLHTSTCVLL